MGLVKIKSIDERINDLTAYLEDLKRIRDTEPKGIEEIICKKYVELGQVKKVLEYLNENGYRKDSGSKYINNNISEIIDMADKNNIFANEAKRMLKGARKAIGIYN